MKESEWRMWYLSLTAAAVLTGRSLTLAEPQSHGPADTFVRIGDPDFTTKSAEGARTRSSTLPSDSYLRLRTGFYVHLRVPHFVAIPFAVETADLIVTAPEKLGAALAQRLAIRVVPHPIKLPEFQVNQFWHRRFRGDAANKWLRSVFTMLFRE